MSQDSADLASFPVPRRVQPVERAPSHIADRVFSGLLLGSAWIILIVVIGLLAVLVKASWPALTSIGFAAAKIPWSPTDDQYGVLSFVYGTVVTSIIALALAGPIGIAVALFLSELAPKKLAGPVGMLVELLAAVPSVVYGLWGLFVLAPVMRTVIQPTLGKTLGFLPLFEGPPLGIGMLTGGILLSIMILPTVAAIARDVFAAVPNDQREGMLALGSTRWEMLTKAVLPYARSGVIGALVLALGRAMGEAMAVVMVIGNTPAISASLFRPAYTMASVLANEFTEATGQQYVSMLIEIGLLLFGLSVIVNIIARALVWSVSPKGVRAA
ncbi:MAG TPA: phosphate ABC transporter permease subunit PstC [Candidatus Eremiobacteraceae bacterium]|nr:phosphate ABC transporter permease subunit PstC [Candidatus Eremiobacteraceae bacterium]